MNWRGQFIKPGLKGEAETFYRNPFRIPQADKDLVKKEVEKLESVGLLTMISDSEWAARTFVIQKKNTIIRFLTNFRDLNC